MFAYSYNPTTWEAKARRSWLFEYMVMYSNLGFDGLIHSIESVKGWRMNKWVSEYPLSMMRFSLILSSLFPLHTTVSLLLLLLSSF